MTDIDTKLELLITQQRVIIDQNDKILEFMDSLTRAWAVSEGAEEPHEEPSREEATAFIESALQKVLGEEKGEGSWGMDAEKARKKKGGKGGN